MMKKRLFWGGIALLAVLLAMGITGCGDSDSGGSGKSDNTQLSSITVEGAARVEFDQSAAKGSWSEITKFAIVKLTGSQSNKELLVTLVRPNLFKGKTEIAKAAKGGTPSAFGPFTQGTTKFAFADGDRIYIKMTAEDGTTVKYYGAEIEVGSDAGLRKITFDGQNVDNDYLGSPAASLAAASEGEIHMLTPMPAYGLTVAITPNDPGAAVSFGKSGAAESGWATASSAVIFTSGDVLGVKVTSQNGQVTQYYKIKVTLKSQLTEIAYGTPKLHNPAGSDDDWVDTVFWDKIEELPVKKQNSADASQGFFENPGTEGRAKLSWDENGLWLYIEVQTENRSSNSGFGADGSSVELFINEKYPGTNAGSSYDNIGGLYRLGTDDIKTGYPEAALTAFKNLDQYRLDIRDPVSGYGGYFVIFKAPWRFKDANPLNGKDISIEIQVNAVGSSGTGRVGILKWYNTTGNPNQDVSVLAPAKLKQ
jgi:hypothetical protein